MAALCVLSVGIFDRIYIVAMSLYLCLEGAGLGAIKFISKFPQKNFSLPSEIYIKKEYILSTMYVKGGYILAAWILFFAIVYFFTANRPSKLK